LLVAAKTFSTASGELFREGTDRISEDHPLAARRADAFRPAPDFPPSGPITRIRGAGPSRPREARTATADEKRRMAARIAEIDSEAAPRNLPADRQDGQLIERLLGAKPGIAWQHSHLGSPSIGGQAGLGARSEQGPFRSRATRRQGTRPAAAARARPMAGG
jgi:hypothetical protein